MSLISSVTGAAASLAAGLDPVTTTARRAPGQPASGPGGLASPGAPDLLTAMLGPGVSASKGGSGKAGSASAGTARAAKAGGGSGSAKASAAKSGYAKAPAGDAFAFLKDPALSVEEKLFRFMCAVAKRNDDELVRKMEEMKGGQAPAAGGKAGGTSGGAGAAKKPAALNVWGALKALVPPLGMAAQLVGDARLKSLITQVSGPVLAAAATALGMPALAPLALKAGPGLASAAMEGKLGGGAAAAAVGGAAGGTGGGASSGGTGQAAGAAGSGQSEQLQMMELQRLVDKQKEMFAMISSVLRSQHDTRMAIIGNVR